MPLEAYAITFVPRVNQNDRRKLPFISSTLDREVDALKVFESSVPKVQQTLRGWFDHWLAGIPYPKHYHGWDHEPNKALFVFKWMYKQKFNRFYGFLCHPKPQSDPRLQLCVLASHAIKKTWETDPAELAGIRRLLTSPAVVRAVTILFPEYRGEGREK